MLVAALLAQRGWHCITPMSLALPVLFIGGTMYVNSFAGTWLTTILALLLVAWGGCPYRVGRRGAADG
jgi:hypothetical protein